MDWKNDSATETIDLSAFDDEYGRAEIRSAPEIEAEEIPDGIYDASVEDIHLTRTANTGNPMILYKLRIVGPTCEGRAVTKVRVITQKTLPFVKEDMRRLNVNLERLSDLSTRVDDIVDRRVRIFKRTNPERRWTDVYFIRDGKGPARETSVDGPAELAWRTGTDDDLPF
ncbi:MAG: DUF669 domain-containing protein [Candidatus Solibacter usitatus]|nr:DUF669 domain-containing protein [Candidatus Solibacter usitatus]